MAGIRVVKRPALWVVGATVLGVSSIGWWDVSFSFVKAADQVVSSPGIGRPILSEPGYRKPSVSPQRPTVKVSQTSNRGKTQEPQPAPAPTWPSAAEDKSLTEPPTIVGRVIFRGAVPPATQIEVTRDQDVCGQIMTLDALSVDSVSRGVRNAVVHLNVGGQPPLERPTSVSIVKNRQCKFYPRVAVAQTGAETEISNDDPVMHNTNMSTFDRTVLNVAVVPGSNPIRKPLKKAGVHLVKCNVHKFMQAYRVVFDDPYFDQTNEAGQFRIIGVPSGPQTITVWHETLGTFQKEVQVPAKGTVTVDLEFK